MPMFRIVLLDYMENTIGEITQSISEENAGSISVNYGQGVRRSCSFTLNDPNGYYAKHITELFGFNTKYKLFVGLKDTFTEDVYWFSQGIFYSINPTSSRGFVTVDGVDKFGMLTGETGYSNLAATHLITAETNAYSAIKDILMIETGNGRVIDPISPILDPIYADYPLPYDIQKDPNATYGDIIIEIANVLGCDVFYDTNGRLNITNGTLDFTYEAKSPIWSFTDVLPEYMNSEISLNTVDAVNVVVVSSNNLDNNLIYTSTVRNDNPASPVSIDKIGFKYFYEESSSISTQSEADDYANLLLRKLSIIAASISFESTLLPHLDANNVVSVDDSYYSYVQQRFIIGSIDIPLDASGTMQIKASNIVGLPYYDLRNG